MFFDTCSRYFEMNNYKNYPKRKCTMYFLDRFIFIIKWQDYKYGINCFSSSFSWGFVFNLGIL